MIIVTMNIIILLYKIQSPDQPTNNSQRSNQDVNSDQRRDTGTYRQEMQFEMSNLIAAQVIGCGGHAGNLELRLNAMRDKGRVGVLV